MIVSMLVKEFGLKEQHIKNVLDLIADGNTIPFIARYRKEMHGSMDDQTLREVVERAEYLKNMEVRKEEVAHTITEQEKMTDEIREALSKATTMTEVEDIYRPFRPKRRTRASIAKERGLEPLAEKLLLQERDSAPPLVLALPFVNEALEVPTAEDALLGAQDIIAEMVSDTASVRQVLRGLFWNKGIVTSKVSGEDVDEDRVYEMYYEFEEKVQKLPGYRVLALNRGEREDVLKVSILLDEEESISHISPLFLEKHDSPVREAVQEAIADAYKRLLFPSVERETRNSLTETAETDAIAVFSENLRNLLMAPPIKGNVTLGLDPGFRTGCKLAVIDETGRVLDTGVIYNTAPHNKVAEAKTIVLSLMKKYGVQVIAIGNGTASRESEQFIAELLSESGSDAAYIIVNEAGASVYSASKLAAEEFPQFDVSIRSAVSIARRLQDPLAELVKIDPKSVGVGQYQHDMPKAQLSDSLDSVVEDCVNSVGVDLNTASVPLLKSVAGVNATVAKNIVLFREENGAFSSRKGLAKVPKLGKKTFEQCAGFLRVTESENILDNTAVHPESYKAAEQLLKLCGFSLMDVRDGNIGELTKIMEQKGKESLAEELSVGVPTLIDIAKELQKPGRDPRDELPKPLLRKDVLKMEDLEEGMELVGTVRNVIDFGAFVDIGVHEDGLVHISQLADRFVKNPADVVKVGDVVKVKVLEVDIKRKRIGLTMRGLN